jgi:dipeptidyl aminopeptidase/acylaminoacyl peptidase
VVAELVLHRPNATIVAARKPNAIAAAPSKTKPEIAAAQVHSGQTAELGGYRQPPAIVRDILDAPPFPTISIDPTRKRFLLVHSVKHPPIADLAAPMLGLAGLRINPRTNGPHRPPRVTGLTLQQLDGGDPQPLPLPADGRFGTPQWSPDGLRFAVTHTLSDGIELWLGDGLSGQLSRVPDLRLNLTYGDPVQWMPDSKSLLCQSIVVDRGAPPAPPSVPFGPTIEQSFGKKGAVRTFQDLLQNAYDEDLFDYYALSQLVLVQATGNRLERVGKPGIFRAVEPSPDGNHLLVVTNHRPYSYLHNSSAFPREVEIWDRLGNTQFKLASLPLADQVPIEGVPTGPRDVQWRATEPATVIWVEALDEGDPKKQVPHRDRLLMLNSPFDGESRELARLEHRFAGITWGERDDWAFIRDYDRDRRWGRTFLVHADQPDHSVRLIWDRSVLDRYNDPGTPVVRKLPNGKSVVWQHGDSIYLSGQGASAQGDRPFLDRFDLKSLASQRLFQCGENRFESVVGLVDGDASRFIFQRESTTDPPNYFLSLANGERQLTHFSDPAPQLRGIHKQLVTYSRHDGVQLSFTLYLPADYKPGQRLPTIVWAYPREFTDAVTAGQVSGSPHRFTTLEGISHLFLVTQGYAVLDGATMPVIGDPETANNTYLQQIVASAQAAIDKGVEMGVVDRNRVGVGGHSYGAFMTANLLAHSDLFRAGVARSGAYNRTLTPFGFQAERRTLWEAPEVYRQVSPFMFAHQINEPILLIHGAADDNPGTFPIQSERLFQAIRGNSGQVRLVKLPFESHGYVARESVQHTLHEMITWFDKYVKNAR